MGKNPPAPKKIRPASKGHTVDDDDELHNKPAHTVPMRSVRQRPENQKDGGARLRAQAARPGVGSPLLRQRRRGQPRLTAAVLRWGFREWEEEWGGEMGVLAGGGPALRAAVCRQGTPETPGIASCWGAGDVAVGAPPSLL